uniref:MYND-type domain-containing protein n=2 Tax=Clytia hemisphaerica TaxID=252671 RepID=A0A7M5WUE6_9CNID
MKKFLLEKKSKNLKLDLNNNNSSMKTTIVIPTANLVHSTTTKVKTPVTPCNENPIFVKKRESPDGKSIDIPARPVVELNIPKITKEFFSNVKPSSPNMCAQSKQTKIEFPSNNNHIKIKRQISDIRHSRPVPQIFSPSISPPISSYRPSRSPTSPLEETKTKIYRPEDIERCLMNVSPVEHSKFVYHQPVYRETRETTIYPIAEDVFTEVQDIRRVHHRPSFPYYRDRKSPCKSRLHSESSVELPQRSRLQSHPFFEPKETERYAKNIEKSPAKHAHKRLLSETKYDSQPKHLTTLKRPSSGDSYHDIPLKRRFPASVSSPISTVYHHPSTILSPNTRTSSFPRSQEVYYRKEEFFVCSPTNSKSPKTYQQQELKKTQPKELKTLKNHNCLSCGRPAQLLCSACRLVRYCSRKCQLDDWKEHLYQCNIKK